MKRPMNGQRGGIHTTSREARAGGGVLVCGMEGAGTKARFVGENLVYPVITRVPGTCMS